MIVRCVLSSVVFRSVTARTEEQCASVYMPEITNHFFFTYRNVKNRREFSMESVAPYTKKG